MAPGQIYETPGLVVDEWAGVGRRVVTTRRIEAGETVVVWSGQPLTGSEVAGLSNRERDFILQVDDDLYLATSLNELGTADFINHSCDPNCGFTDSVTLVAMRPIEAGEVLTFDYAMSDTNSFVSFDCACGTTSCRGRFSGDDWRNPDLQRRYAGWFSPHVQRLIDRTT